MNTQCPKCKQIFETEENAVGQWVTCPQCSGEWCILSPEEEQNLIDAQNRLPEITPSPVKTKQKETPKKDIQKKKKKQKLEPGCWLGIIILVAIFAFICHWGYNAIIYRDTEANRAFDYKIIEEDKSEGTAFYKAKIEIQRKGNLLPTLQELHSLVKRLAGERYAYYVYFTLPGYSKHDYFANTFSEDLGVFYVKCTGYDIDLRDLYVKSYGENYSSSRYPEEKEIQRQIERRHNIPQPGTKNQVSLDFWAYANQERQAIVHGKTNLPPGTILMISISDNATGQIRGQTKTTVKIDGGFMSEALGRNLPDGTYTANVTMPVIATQPAEVQNRTGRNGEYLSGSILKRNDFDCIYISENKIFSIGDNPEQAEKEQKEKAEDQIKTFKRELCIHLEKLLSFKNNSDFIQNGFGRGGNYYSWMITCQQLQEQGKAIPDYDLSVAPR